MKMENRNPLHVIGRFIFFFLVLVFFHGFREITPAASIKLILYALIVTFFLEIVRYADKKKGK